MNDVKPTIGDTQDPIARLLRSAPPVVSPDEARMERAMQNVHRPRSIAAPHAREAGQTHVLSA